ncbi:hypothetical protein [Microbispora sp. NBRC 16548]|uniref:hypothetical protein n=1 Tax=Microbispora sp. NBRC 16548 TaxID=3030994 RepID=UPI0024A0F7D2|nr:hypothetical protein [Microbispora sp. NBRC 16548]GLX08154.1 hypothetical protein Misp03_50800 [Microbispora sp. NBRC 16548]
MRTNKPYLLAAAVLAGPIAGVVWHLVDTVGLPRTEAADYLAQVAADRDGYALGTLLYMIFVGCSIPGGLAVARVLRDRAPLAGTISGLLLALAGVLGLIVSGMRPVVLGLAPEGGVAAEAVAAYGKYQGSAWFGGIMLPMLASAVVGLVTQVAAILRTGALPRWTAPLLVAGFVLSSGEFSLAVTVVGALVQLTGTVPLAARLLAGPEAASEAEPAPAVLA